MRVPRTIVVSAAIVILCAQVGYGWESACIQSITPNPACLGTQQSFTAGSGCTYPGTPVWDFGDGSHASGMSVTHTYTLSGSRMVVLETHHGRETATAVGYATVAEVMCIWEEPPGVFSETSEPGEDETIYVSDFWAEIDGISLGVPQESWPAGEPEWDAGGGELFDDPYNGAGYKIFYPNGPGWYTVRVSCGDSSKAIKICAIEVTVTASKEGTCVGGDVTFTANATPGGLGDKTVWEAEGATWPTTPPVTTGQSITVYWADAGTPRARATVAGVTSASKEVRVAKPVNFRRVGSPEIQDANLTVAYRWESSSDNLEDLTGLRVGEWVDYPGGSLNTWPNITSPIVEYCYPTPMVGRARNPTVRTNTRAELGGMTDTHNSPGFAKPYVSEYSVVLQQVYWYRNPTRTGGNGQTDEVPWTPTTNETVYGKLLGPITINKYVELRGTVWHYCCVKGADVLDVVLP